ncbi:MAG TPA: hypothetical protein VE913_23335 [Longimicrobium sp.]|nr:hypothetical protein [Longimicrobium sp.]
MARNPRKAKFKLLAVVAAAAIIGVVVGYLLLQVTILRWSTG